MDTEKDSHTPEEARASLEDQAEAALGDMTAANAASKVVVEVVQLCSVGIVPRGSFDSSGTCTVEDENGALYRYSTDPDGFEVVYQQKGDPYLVRHTVAERNDLGLLCNKKITRLYVNQPQGE